MDRDRGLLVPPHSIDAEQAVLGGLMLAQSALANVSGWLEADDFYRPDHRALYRAIVELSGKNIPCDAVTMADWMADSGVQMPGGPTYLLEITNSTPSAVNIAAYGEIVLEKSRLRQLIALGADVSADAFKRGASADQITAVASHRLSQLTRSLADAGLQSARTALTEFFQDLAATYERGEGLLGIPTPWDEVNARLLGLEDELVYLVAARPSMGKSVFAGGVCVHAASLQHNTLLFSPEMTAKQYMRRATAAVGRIPYDWLRKPYDHPDSEMFWQRTTDAVAQLRDIPLQIDATPGITIEQIEARCLRENLRRKVRLVVIDHLHEVGLDPNKPRVAELGRVMQGLRRIAKVLKCPVLVMAQLSRKLLERADKRPILSDLRDSGEIEQIADVIAFLHRQDYYDKDTWLKEVVELILAKGRDLDLGAIIYLLNRFDQQRLENWMGDYPTEPIASPPPRAQKGGGIFNGGRGRGGPLS